MKVVNLTPRHRINLREVRRWKVRGLRYAELRKRMPARKLNYKMFSRRIESCMYSHVAYLMNARHAARVK